MPCGDYEPERPPTREERDRYIEYLRACVADLRERAMRVLNATGDAHQYEVVRKGVEEAEHRLEAAQREREAERAEPKEPR